MPTIRREDAVHGGPLTSETAAQIARVFFESVDPILIEDLAGTIIAANAAAKERYGCGELVGRALETVLPADEHERLAALRERCRRGDTIRDVRMVRVDRRGIRSPILVSLSLLRDADGTPMGRALISKELDAAEVGSHAAIFDPPGILTEVLERVPVAVAVADAPGGRLLHANRAFEALHGHATTVAEMRRRFFTADEEPCPTHELPLARAVRGESVGPVDLRVERDDELVELEVQAMPLYDTTGALRAAAAVVVDVSAQRRLERERDLFLGALAHDLRGPLSTISLAANLLQDRCDEAEERVRLAQRIRHTSARMMRMIGQLMAYARASTGGFAPELQPFRLAEVVRDVVAEARLAWPGRAIEERLHDEGEGLGDRDLLLQAVQNLVANALQHGAQDAPVSIELRRTGDELSLEVENQGEADPEELRASLFEPFRRRSRSGLGLGLFIVAQIVGGHGGQVVAESADGRTWVRIRLPAGGPEQGAD